MVESAVDNIGDLTCANHLHLAPVVHHQQQHTKTQYLHCCIGCMSFLLPNQPTTSKQSMYRCNDLIIGQSTFQSLDNEVELSAILLGIRRQTRPNKKQMSNEKKRSERHKHCALAVVRRSQKISPAKIPFSGARDSQNLISWRWSLPVLQTQFGEDRCTQFRVIVVTDPPTNTQTKQRIDRTDYNTLCHSLARRVKTSTMLLAGCQAEHMRYRTFCSSNTQRLFELRQLASPMATMEKRPVVGKSECVCVCECVSVCVSVCVCMCVCNCA